MDVLQLAWFKHLDAKLDLLLQLVQSPDRATVQALSRHVQDKGAAVAPEPGTK